MGKGAVVYRIATNDDIGFLSEILVGAAVASGVDMQVKDLPAHPDTYVYIEGFPKGADVGIVAETNDGILIGAAWVRLLPYNVHAVNEPLPELTMGVVREWQRMGIGKRLMVELCKAASAKGISKISLGVHRDNIPAVNLYNQLRWIKDGYFRDYIMMSKCI